MPGFVQFAGAPERHSDDLRFGVLASPGRPRDRPSRVDPRAVHQASGLGRAPLVARTPRSCGRIASAALEAKHPLGAQRHSRTFVARSRGVAAATPLGPRAPRAWSAARSLRLSAAVHARARAREGPPAGPLDGWSVTRAENGGAQPAAGVGRAASTCAHRSWVSLLLGVLHGCGSAHRPQSGPSWPPHRPRSGPRGP